MGIESSGKGPTPPSRVTLDVAAGESLSRALIDRFTSGCDLAEDLGSSAIVVLALNAAASGDSRERVDTALVTQWERALRRIERLPTVVVAVASGICSGLAAAALLTADYRIGTPGFKLSFAGAPAELLAGMVGYRLETQAGMGVARRMLLWEMELGADKALELGVLDECSADHEAALAALVERLSRVDRADLAVRRRMLLQDWASSFEDALGQHLAACDRAIRSSS